MELCNPVMTRVAALRLHRVGIERLTALAQPPHAAFYAASSLDSQLELCILSQEPPHKAMRREGSRLVYRPIFVVLLPKGVFLTLE